MPEPPLRAIAELTAELQLKHSLEEILQLAVDRAAQLLGVKQVSIRLLDATRTRLLVGCRAGAPVHENGTFEFKVGEGLVGWVAQQNLALQLSRVADDPRFMARDDQRQPIGSFLAVPLSHEGRCIGVISATHSENGFFNDGHHQLLTLLSGLCSPHIEAVRLRRL